MAFVEYQLADFRKNWLIREKKNPEQSRLHKSTKITALSLSVLEEEIHTLRCELERLVAQGREMTSDAVVHISTILDLKINEYMEKMKKSR